MRSVTHNFSVTYQAEPEAIAQARGALGEFARGAGAKDDEVDSVRLAVSEAVTNAVLHGYRGEPGAIQVTAALTGQELWILVADEGGGMQTEAERPGLGLGLGLISQMCDDMAIVARSAGGIEVRLLFKLSGAADRRSGGAVTPAAERGFPEPDSLSAVRHAPARD